MRYIINLNNGSKEICGNNITGINNTPTLLVISLFLSQKVYLARSLKPSKRLKKIQKKKKRKKKEERKKFFVCVVEGVVLVLCVVHYSY